MPDRDPSQRVVVTCLVFSSPLGLSVTETWDAAIAGRSGAATIQAFDPEGYASTIAAEVKGDLELGDVEPKEVRRRDRVGEGRTRTQGQGENRDSGDVLHGILGAKPN